jgi:hypothetical protein
MSGARLWALAVLLLVHAGLAAAATDPAKPIVNDDWEVIERIELPAGVIQLRVRAKVASKPEQAKEIPATAAIVDSIKQIVGADLSVPSSPAMAVLGMTGTEVQRPAFPRDFAASLVRGFDKNGKTKNAIAIDIVPAALFFPGSIVSTVHYKDDYLTQLLARTTVSLASAHVEGDSQASQMAAGVRIGLFDMADPGLYTAQTAACVIAHMRKLPVRMGPGKGLAQPEAYAEFKEAANKTCRLNVTEFDLWAKPALYAGYAQGWYSSSGAIKDAGGSAKSLWMSYSIGHGRTRAEIENGEKTDQVRALLQVYLARRLNERAKDPVVAGQLVREDRSELIARVRFGKEKWHGYLDGGLARVNSAGVGTEQVRRLGLGFEYQLRDHLWLVAGSVRETGFAAGDRVLVSTGLRFGQTPVSILAPPGGKPANPDEAK